ncbi:hypothetical protein D9Q81_04085 [Candidatus Korarchaeum cryptofilum]|uniref:Uncharacterized protein n=1 Tax=Candidatus Korarchaeum cryptofilum TaxID=498846 RepID=A0A3R9PAA8_9CREN|nr:hypothetical protein [Candidatus Korarchaeum cryptofilum]RSN69197.1 hypothetical protein D9Q81_04085 [Candidatus Korarchaeum cryptofilum]
MTKDDSAFLKKNKDLPRDNPVNVMEVLRLAVVLGLLILLMEPSAMIYAFARLSGYTTGHWAADWFCSVVGFGRGTATLVKWLVDEGVIKGTSIIARAAIPIASPTPLGWALLAVTIGCG